eukprot:10106960-Lingulodinium_polyedra.AAC.1
MARANRVHGARALLPKLVKTNACPWCRSKHASRDVTLAHCRRATKREDQACYADFWPSSAWASA